MIVELSVENIALLAQCAIQPGARFTALTGETGAGKSLIVDALALALGGRADSELIRTGSSKATVALTIDLNGNAPALARAHESGFEPEEGLLYIHREISVEGRSTSRINGRMAPVSTLRQIGEWLVDMHGQHEHQALLHPQSHLRYLDAFIGEEAAQSKEQIAQWVQERSELAAQLHQLRSNRREIEQRIDMLRFQIQEIEAIDPKLDERIQLESEFERAQNAERLQEAVMGSLASLRDDEASALDAIGSVEKQLETVAQGDADLMRALEMIVSGRMAIEEGVAELRRYGELIEGSADRIDEIVARLDAVRKLLRKYGETEALVLEYADDARQQLAALEGDESSDTVLESRLSELDDRLREAARELTAIRKRASKSFADAVNHEIQELAIERGRLIVEMTAQPIDATGGDAVQFLFSANQGEAERPLSKVASGGELSRIMLAFKVVLAGRGGMPTLVFDEIDAGLSGRAAAVVARKLEQIAQNYQVIAISHLPQIAGRADTHFKIEKGEEEGRTVTDIRLLEGEERVEEIARLLAGERIGDSALANARDFLTLR